VKMPENRFKRAINAGQPQVGLWLMTCSAIVAECAAYAGVNWVLIDGEHAPNDIPTIEAQLHAVSAAPATPMVRVAWNDPVLIKQLLDIGVQSLLIPYIQNIDEARAAVSATRYPPGGIRGVALGGTRATRYGAVENYVELVQRELCVIVQIETKTALNNIDAIATVDGIDGIFVGPNDLAASLGHLGNVNHPEVVKAIDHAIETCLRLNKPAGILTGTAAQAHKYFKQGFVFVAGGSDIGLLSNGVRNLARDAMPAAIP
jgi:4-hydroxy-2-oxoheptanedioate aldolase